MIPLPPELEKAERDLLDRRITGSEASEIVFTVRKKLGLPWHWKSWKLARQKVLATECATCGAGKEAILYLQHTFRSGAKSDDQETGVHIKTSLRLRKIRSENNTKKNAQPSKPRRQL